MTSVIDAFIDAYRRELDFYQEAARICAQQCERLLRDNGIRSIVTFRAKHPERLREKLVKRNSEHNYESADQIRSDIVDLAGVRAALYFPGDRAKCAKIVSEALEVIATKEFPEPGGPQEGKRFTGYHATHFRVHLSPGELSDDQQRYASAPIEVQVASVLMHAWSEVEHDLAYKPLSGELSEDEIAILDE